MCLQLCRVLRQQRDEAWITCKACGKRLARLNCRITMTETEHDTVFVNPHGHTHGLTCVSEIRQPSVTCEGEPSESFSWFPGYAWTSTTCAGCDHHLGWRFTTRTQPQRHLHSVDRILDEFWGFSQESVVVCLGEATDVFGDPSGESVVVPVRTS
jgi:hypothetical protein